MNLILIIVEMHHLYTSSLLSEDRVFSVLYEQRTIFHFLAKLNRQLSNCLVEVCYSAICEQEDGVSWLQLELLLNYVHNAGYVG